MLNFRIVRKVGINPTLDKIGSYYIFSFFNAGSFLNRVQIFMIKNDTRYCR